jgi:GT2 family glycosyltransferase
VKESINAVIVTYNNRELLKRCIGSVMESLRKVPLLATITVVDNDSTDGTDDMVRKLFPDVNYIRNPENMGLSRALNIGIKQRLDSDYTLLLNDDVEMLGDTISILINTLKRFRSAGGVPAALIHSDGSSQWMKLRLLGTAKEHGTRTRRTRFASTTACLYKTELFRKYGGFDEFYFFYNEDLDFSVRMKRKKVRFVFNPEARAVHHQAQGRSKAEKVIRPYFYATDYYFYRKNYGPLFSSVYLIMALFHIAFWKRKFKSSHNNVKLEMLEMGRKKLKETIKNYRELVRGAHDSFKS